MPTLSISRPQAKELLEFCKSHAKEEFFVAKDQGVYFGATAGSGEEFENSIHYVKHCDPRKDDWYDYAVDKFGGDDFGVHLPVQWLNVFATDPHWAYKNAFSIRLNQKSVTLVK